MYMYMYHMMYMYVYNYQCVWYEYLSPINSVKHRML